MGNKRGRSGRQREQRRRHQAETASHQAARSDDFPLAHLAAPGARAGDTRIARKKSPLPADLNRGERIKTFEITYEKLEGPPEERLPRELEPEYNAIYRLLMAESEEDPLPRINALLANCPNQPKILSLLATALRARGDFESADTVAETLYRQHPRYLFARVHWGKVLLERGDVRGYEAVMEHCFNLAQLYPRRKVFHISEVTSFFYVTVMYLVLTNQVEKTAPYVSLLKKVAAGAVATLECQRLVSVAQRQRRRS